MREGLIPDVLHLRSASWLLILNLSFGMKFTDKVELFKIEDVYYALEDESGAVIVMADTCEVWYKKNRGIFAGVKNAKTKTIERFFSTFEQLCY